jgi:hypothetical protein
LWRSGDLFEHCIALMNGKFVIPQYLEFHSSSNKKKSMRAGSVKNYNFFVMLPDGLIEIRYDFIATLVEKKRREIKNNILDE